MAVPACYVSPYWASCRQHLWAHLLPGRDPVVVTVEAVRIDRDRHGRAVWATLDVRTRLGNVVTISQSDILRLAS